MIQLRLRNAMGAFVWMSIGLAVLNDYLQAKWVVDEIYAAGAYCVYWVPRISPAMFLPFLLASGFTLFGRVRTGMVLGTPAVVYLAFRIWTICAEQREQLEIQAIGS